MEEGKYTGRQIAILTDAHGLLEPVEAILKDINSRGIKEVYSLGDNIGEGPNSQEVVQLLYEKGVVSLAGNAEEYIRLGLGPFRYAWDRQLPKLDENCKGIINLYPHFIKLVIGGKKVALVHFTNDVRYDFVSHSTWSYQGHFDVDKNLGEGVRRDLNASEQFFHANELEEIKNAARRANV